MLYSYLFSYINDLLDSITKYVIDIAKNLARSSRRIKSLKGSASLIRVIEKNFEFSALGLMNTLNSRMHAQICFKHWKQVWRSQNLPDGEGDMMSLTGRAIELSHIS